MRIIDSLRFTLKKQHHYDIDVISRTINKVLTEISDALGGVSWFEKSESRKEALHKNVSSYRDIKDIIIKEWDNNYANLGCDFTFWSPSNDIEIGFRIGVDKSCKVIDNNIFIALPLLRLSMDSTIVSKIKEIIYYNWTVTEFEVIY